MALASAVFRSGGFQMVEDSGVGPRSVRAVARRLFAESSTTPAMFAPLGLGRLESCNSALHGPPKYPE